MWDTLVLNIPNAWVVASIIPSKWNGELARWSFVLTLWLARQSEHSYLIETTLIFNVTSWERMKLTFFVTSIKSWKSLTQPKNHSLRSLLQHCQWQCHCMKSWLKAGQYSKVQSQSYLTILMSHSRSWSNTSRKVGRPEFMRCQWVSCHPYLNTVQTLSYFAPVLNPDMKFDWISKHWEHDNVSMVQEWILETVTLPSLHCESKHWAASTTDDSVSNCKSHWTCPTC